MPKWKPDTKYRIQVFHATLDWTAKNFKGDMEEYREKIARLYKTDVENVIIEELDNASKSRTDNQTEGSNG